MPDSNEAVLRQLYRDVWNGEHPESANELVHSEYLIHERDLADEKQGPELYRALASATRNIFSDIEFTIEDTVAAGDKVALRWTMKGTHDSSLYGVEPTGKRIELSAIEINRFKDRKLVETWTQSDQFSLMEQIGAMEANE